MVRQQTFLESSAVPLELLKFCREPGLRFTVQRDQIQHSELTWVTYKALAILPSGELATVQKALNGSYFCLSTKQHRQIKNFLVSATLNWKQYSAGLPGILKQGCGVS